MTPPKDREPIRRAEFVSPPNTLKMKVGTGGLDEKILIQAQKLIDDSGIDFIPQGQRYLAALHEALRMAETQRGKIEDETLIIAMLYPGMHMKANGGMFGYPMVTEVASRLIRFLENVKEPDSDVLDIVHGFSNALQAVMLMGKTPSSAERINDLCRALDEACDRYFIKHTEI